MFNRYPWNVGGIVLCLLAGLFLANESFAQQKVKVGRLSFRPTLDGSGGEWKSVKATFIPVTGKLAVKKVSLKAGVYGNEVFFLIQWKDSTEDNQHKPFVWDAKKNKYVAGPQREDRFALQFAMGGDYSANWFSGNAFKADMWHWKAARTNPVGLAHDKMTVISLSPLKKAFQAKADNGREIYIRRPSDAGGKIYKTKRYRKKQKNLMPKYILSSNVSGSVTDVKAKGVWSNGTWTLEIGRKLNTGNSDDVAFSSGRAVKGGVAVFDRSGDDKHNRSETLLFRF